MYSKILFLSLISVSAINLNGMKQYNPYEDKESFLSTVPQDVKGIINRYVDPKLFKYFLNKKYLIPSPPPSVIYYNNSMHELIVLYTELNRIVMIDNNQRQQESLQRYFCSDLIGKHFLTLKKELMDKTNGSRCCTFIGEIVKVLAEENSEILRGHFGYGNQHIDERKKASTEVVV